LHNRRIASTLSDLELRPGDGSVGENLIRCYEALVSAGFLPSAELPSVKAWLVDLEGSR